MPAILPGSPAAARAARCRGDVLPTTLHIVLLLAVLGQIVYLGSRHRLRFDTTADDLYSLTDSTRTIVGGLEKRLVIEAYLSPKEELPSQLRDTRTVLDNFLDELVQLGKGKVAVQRFNPFEDTTIRDKCTRLGVKPIDVQTSSTNAMERKQHWQGLRFVYGGGKQKVIDRLAPQNSFVAEAILTPAIKEVITKVRRKVGFMEWPSDPAPGQQQGLGWNQVRSVDEVAKRYDLQNLKDAEGALVPAEVETLLLFRPKDVTDRQKYVIDQFLLRGGTVVLFADVADYGLAQRRPCNRLAFTPDAKDSQQKLQDQLLHYGLALSGRIVADLQPEAWRAQNPMMGGQEYFGVPSQMGFVQQAFGYPYFFAAVDLNWADYADQLATISGQRDPQLAEHYRATLRPGIDTDEFLFKAFKQWKRGPGFYWPCSVDLRRKDGVAGATDLPSGVDGRVLLWSSPLSLVEDPPGQLNPLGNDPNPAKQNDTLRTFHGNLQKRLQSEPRRQVPLMVDLRGTFPSFFAGKERPKKASEIKEEEARKAAAAEKEKAEPEPPQDPAAQPPVGPPAPEPKPPEDTAPKVVEPEPLLAATAPGRIVAIGDSDFVRDDFVRGDYRQLGGPQSLFGAFFFSGLLDWISQDSDLVALQSRVPADRKLDLLASPAGGVENQRAAELALTRKTAWLVRLNYALPCLVLLALGLVVLVTRRTQKRLFLESIGD